MSNINIYICQIYIYMSNIYIYIYIYVKYIYIYIYICNIIYMYKSATTIIEGSLEVKLPTIWTVEKQR